MREEERKQYKAELDELHKITRPWCFETGRSLAELPDINYRKIILDDQESLEQLLVPGRHHFQEKCLLYQKYDVELEVNLLFAYKTWCGAMKTSSKAGNAEEREDFFRSLRSSLLEDVKDVCNELWRHWHDEDMRRGITSSAVNEGSGRFFHMHHRCWFYYDEKDDAWRREPGEEGPEFD